MEGEIKRFESIEMEEHKKEGRYNRIYSQLNELVLKSKSQTARMATIIAVLHHKMEYFFWTGFYLIDDEKMTVNMYQGPVACQILEKDKGDAFPGHIACDSRSNSEIVVPFKNHEGEIIGVLDIDSSEKASFSEVDARWLEKILELVNV